MKRNQAKVKNGLKCSLRDRKYMRATATGGKCSPLDE
jgi:hypothetical protein